MKYFFITIIVLLQFNSYSQVIIDLVEDDDHLLWTSVNQNIQSWNIDNDTPEVQIDNFNCPFNSLSIGYVSINSDTILNTFITSEWILEKESGKILYWNGQTWENFIDAPISGVQGIGSYQNHLYIKSQSPQESSQIHYYDGVELIELDLPFSVFGISDIAVDGNGTAWYASQVFINGNLKMDSIFSFNADLSIFERYPLSETICGSGVYGAAILNDTLYIGLGNFNLDYPNKVISITIEDGEGKVANKIIDFESSFSDLASKHPQKDSIISNIENIESDNFIIYPNLTTRYTLIERTNPKQSQLSVFSSSGNLVIQKQIKGIKTQLDLNNLPPGTYYLRIDGVSKKLIKN